MRFDRQHHHSKSIALRYRIGAAALLMLIAGLASAGTVRADGILSTAPPPLTTLVKFNDQDYQIAYSSSVSLEPISATSVRKVGYGQVSEVNIATTSSGTYSSDGLVSPHVRYPGHRRQPRSPGRRSPPSQPFGGWAGLFDLLAGARSGQRQRGVQLGHRSRGALVHGARLVCLVLPHLLIGPCWSCGRTGKVSNFS